MLEAKCVKDILKREGERVNVWDMVRYQKNNKKSTKPLWRQKMLDANNLLSVNNVWDILV